MVRGTVRSVTDFGAFVDLGGVDGLLHVADMAWHRGGEAVRRGHGRRYHRGQDSQDQPESRRISLGLKQLAPDPWTLAAERFHTGDRVQGKVSRLADFGAFVELLPGVDGLIHVSEMSWSKKIKKPSDVLKTGEMVEAVVLGVNAAERRISLGLKQALGDPWEDAVKKYAAGAVVEGPVTSLTNFGCFVDLGDGIDGMIHISDITREKRLNHPREALTAGQTVRAVVLEVDRERRRIKLGIKQLEPTTRRRIHRRAPGGRIGDRPDRGGSQGRAKVELGEGVFAECRMREEKKRSNGIGHARAGAAKADLVIANRNVISEMEAGTDGGSGAAGTRARRPDPHLPIVKLDQPTRRSKSNWPVNCPLSAASRPRDVFHFSSSIRVLQATVAQAAVRMDEPELIRAAQQGDQRAFEQLVRLYDQSVLRLALNLLRSPEDANDIYQEAFLRVYKNLHTFRFDCSFHTWLYRIVTNLCLDALRKRKVRREESTVVETSEGYLDRMDTVEEERADGDPERRLESRNCRANSGGFGRLDAAGADGF